MTVWYWDPVGGTDGAASIGTGDSFATRRKKAGNFGAAVTAPGDTIRCIQSSAPTSIGNATWKSGGLETKSYIAPTSSTNATPIVFTLSSGNYTTLDPVVGDTLFVSGHTTNTNANGTWTISAVDSVNKKVTIVNADGTNSVGNGVGGATGSIRNMRNATVTLASSLTKTVALTGNKGTKTNWTASANVTCTVITDDYKEGVECQKIDIAAGFTTGLAAYWALPASTDFSGYQQISFWIKQKSGTVGAAGAIQLVLCSDTAGVTAVDSLNIPKLSMGTATDRWTKITIDKGSALGAAIQSIAFYVVTDNGAQVFYIDNVVAVKASSSADALSLTTPIGKNVSTDTFYAIQSINGTRVILDQYCNMKPDPTSALQRGYWGTSETVTTYKRDTILIDDAPVPANWGVCSMNESGSATSYITYSGGWNSTDMSTQTGETWLDGRNGEGLMFALQYTAYLSFQNFAVINAHSIIQNPNGGSFTFDLRAFNNNTGSFDIDNPRGNSLNIDFINNNAGSPAINPGKNGVFTGKAINGSSYIGLALWGFTKVTLSIGISGSGSTGCRFYAAQNTLICPLVQYGMDSGVAFKDYYSAGTDLHDNKVIGATLQYNTNADIDAYYLQAQKGYLVRCTPLSTTSITPPAAGYYAGGGLFVHSAGGVQHADTIYVSGGGTITKQNSVRHTASGYAWKLSPTTTQYFNSNTPMSLKIASWPISSGVATTFKLWMYRDNTGMSARLVVRGGTIAGVDSDVQSSLMSEAINTWGGDGAAGPLTVSVTPTETGVVEVFVECWASSTTYSLYVDDFSVV